MIEEKQEIETVRETSDGNQGRSNFRKKIFKPFLEYRQLPKLSSFKGKKHKQEPTLTLGQIYRDEISVSTVTFEDDSENSSDGDVDFASCECRLKSARSVRSLLSFNSQYFVNEQSSFEDKLQAHAQSFQLKTPLHLSIMYDTRVGEFV